MYKVGDGVYVLDSDNEVFQGEIRECFQCEATGEYLYIVFIEEYGVGGLSAPFKDDRVYVKVS